MTNIPYPKPVEPWINPPIVDTRATISMVISVENGIVVFPLKITVLQTEKLELAQKAGDYELIAHFLTESGGFFLSRASQPGKRGGK